MINQNNPFESLAWLFNNFKKSEVPKDRLVYLKALKEYIKLGERLIKLMPNKELENDLEKLKKDIENYELYPNLNIRKKTQQILAH